MTPLHPSLSALGRHKRFILVKLVPSAKPGRQDKIPVDWRSGQACDAHDPQVWTTAEHAHAVAAAYGPDYLTGFVLTADTGLWCVDADECVTPANQWTPDALALFTALPGAAVELSVSRRGLHFWGTGTVPAHGVKGQGIAADLFTDKRFIALTSEMIGEGSASNDLSGHIAALAAQHFPPRETAAPGQWDSGPCAEWRGPQDDDELIRRAMASHSAAAAFGGTAKASFADLWGGNAQVLGRCYPDSGGRAYDASSADAALAQHLAFWTGKDAERMERLMRRSALARSKWDTHPTYLRGFTIHGACGRQREVLQLPAGPADTWRALEMLPADQLRQQWAALPPEQSRAVLDQVAHRLGEPVAQLRAEVDARQFSIRGDAPLDTARAVLQREFTHADGHRLHYWQGTFYEWGAAKWYGVTTDDVRALLYRFLDREARGEFSPDQTRVTKVLDALKAAAHLDSRSSPPCWIDGRKGPAPGELLACHNGLLHLPTLALSPPTPALFSTNAAPYSYRPDSPQPVQWLEFLQQVWPDDGESVQALQEIFGYLLTPDTSQQKLFLIVGPKRSGKGTIGRVLGRLLGEENVTSPALSSLGGEFGLQPLIGKLAAVVSDARLGGRTDPKAVAENLLRLSGEDRVEVNRKHLPSITLQMPVRFVLLTNELPKLADASGAMASRFIVLKMRQSFYGKEDPGLTGRLLEELPGILNWAIKGWQRLRQRGHFVTPKSAADEVRELADLGSPVLAFVRDACELHPLAEADVSTLYEAFRVWCSDQGMDRVPARQQFGHDLGHSVENLTQHQRGRDQDRARFYRGIQVRADWHGLARMTTHCALPERLRGAVIPPLSVAAPRA